MSTPDAQNSHYSQHASSVPRRPRAVSPDSPVPTTPCDPSMPSLDKEASAPATPPTSESFVSSSSPTSTPIPSSTPSASLSFMQSATETMQSATETRLRVARSIPSGATSAPSPLPPTPSSLPAQPAQVMYPPSLKLPSIQQTVPRTSLPPGSSLLNDDDIVENMPFEHAIDFATQSWDLATGGLKTMTAKREVPTRLDRKTLDLPPDESLDRSTRNYTFALIIMVCIILMLIGSGVVIFVLLQQ